ncbi:MAG: hypothetical protein ACJ0BJ_13235 [Pirellulales bacterium]
MRQLAVIREVEQVAHNYLDDGNLLHSDKSLRSRGQFHTASVHAACDPAFQSHKVSE